MTDTPAPNDIPAILARANAATPGPWHFSATDSVWGHDIHAEIGATGGDFGPHIGKAYDAPDGEFIAHSRTDVPNMAAEILELRAQLEGQKATGEAKAAALLTSLRKMLNEPDEESLAQKREA